MKAIMASIAIIGLKCKKDHNLLYAIKAQNNNKSDLPDRVLEFPGQEKCTRCPRQQRRTNALFKIQYISPIRICSIAQEMALKMKGG